MGCQDNKVKFCRYETETFIAPIDKQKEKAIVEKKSGNPKIFIVHGHDKSARHELENMLFKMGLSPEVLQDIDSDSDTLIEALESKISKDTDLVIVLMTPDDVGRAKDEKDEKPRARQNVIFEMGMAIGKMGRKKVFIIKKEDCDVPTDLSGVIYIPYKNEVKDASDKLKTRLKKNGFIV